MYTVLAAWYYEINKRVTKEFTNPFVCAHYALPYFIWSSLKMADACCSRRKVENLDLSVI